MAHDFVPLFPPSAGPAGAPQNGHPLKVVTRDRPAAAGFEALKPPPPPTDAAPPHAGHGKPVITVDREGDVITFIRVQCPCGLVTELKCAYG